jgi:hypothetical protein
MININRINKLEQKISATRFSGDKLPTKESLRDFMTFQKYFFYLRRRQQFQISQPICRQSHHLILADLVPDIISHKLNRLLIRMPPRSGKTEWAVGLCAYGIAFYPDSEFIYASYSHVVASEQTDKIKKIVQLPEFKMIFGVEVSTDSRAKDHFKTNSGGSVIAAGVGGSIVSFGAGRFHGDDFGGLIIFDDIHKPEDVHSDVIRQRNKAWFPETLKTRLNNPRMTPMIGIGHTLHEDDILSNLARTGNPEVIEKFDTEEWTDICIQALDVNGHSFYPEKYTPEKLIEMSKVNEYVYWSQYQQRPQPAGGSIFKHDKIKILDEIPDNIVVTFITVDTAETSKTYNDATAFSFWGLYKIKENGRETDVYALHWLNAWEIRVEPSELEENFMQFYFECCRFTPSPVVVGIEKKSTGTTLLSVLQKLSKLYVVDTIPHRTNTKAPQNYSEDLKRALNRSNKIDGFLACQSYVHSGRVTFIKNSKISDLCINHLTKITANDTHSHDDLADTMRDAINMGLMSNFVINLAPSSTQAPGVIKGYRAILPRPEYHNAIRR